MITNNQIKFVRSLQLKKNRFLHKCFIVEGEKMVNELLSSDFHVQSIFTIKAWNTPVADASIIHYISEQELKRISGLKSPNNVLAIVEIPKIDLKISDIKKGLTLVLDEVKNPGNLGTIVRVCDWFGVKNIICTKASVELYNPKVIQATMGSFLRVKVHYTEIEKVVEKLPKNFPIYGSFMEGENIADVELMENALLIMGNESLGIAHSFNKFITKKITIKNGKSEAESLNVAIATAILLYEFKR